MYGKGDLPNKKGSTCNIPIDRAQTCQQLPRNLNSSGIVLVKLKRKISYKKGEFHEAVRPELLLNAVNCLIQSNFLYNDVSLNINPQLVINEVNVTSAECEQLKYSQRLQCRKMVV